jgi:phosphohistidine phosphatase
MNLWLMRHTEPVHGHPLDATRPLKDSGTKQAGDMAAWLTNLIGRVDIVISSPFVRAMQTAEIMADALGSYVADTRMLSPDGDPAEMFKEIERLAQQSKDVLIVGHDPSLQALVVFLTDLVCEEGTTAVESIRFDWGAIASIKGSRLMWLVTPALVIPPPEEQEVLEAARELASVL